MYENVTEPVLSADLTLPMHSLVGLLNQLPSESVVIHVRVSIQIENFQAPGALKAFAETLRETIGAQSSITTEGVQVGSTIISLVITRSDLLRLFRKFVTGELEPLKITAIKAGVEFPAPGRLSFSSHRFVHWIEVGSPTFLALREFCREQKPNEVPEWF